MNLGILVCVGSLLAIVVMAAARGTSTLSGTASSATGTSDAARVTTSADSSTTTDFTSLVHEWYEGGSYMGYWAGNVETIPSKSRHLPDFFYSSPTPSSPIRTDSRGDQVEKDPRSICKPLWVFGDEVRVTDYRQIMRQVR